MNRNEFRWTRLCVSATTALITGCAWTAASASQTHILQHGETLASIARQYHVSIQDIVRANALSNPDSIRDGHRLIIPDPPKHLALPATLHRTTAAKSDRVNVRLGPGGDYRSIWMYDMGQPVVVTAEKDGWAQVALPDGRNGWVRQDLLKSGGKNEPAQQANNSKKPNVPKPAPIVALAPDRTRRNASVKPAGASAGASRKSHETQHPPKVAHHAAHAQAREQAAHHNSHTSHASHTAKTTHHSRHEETRQVAHHSSGSRHSSGHYTPEANAPDSDSDIVRTAYAYRGTPYHYGSSGRGSFDCSGFTSYLYAKKGVSLPHSAKGQFGEGHQVSRGELKPGDLVFFHTVTSGISHVGMYVGEGKFVHCSSRRSGGVRVDNLDSGYYSKAYRGARRVK